MLQTSLYSPGCPSEDLMWPYFEAADPYKNCISAFSFCNTSKSGNRNCTISIQGRLTTVNFCLSRISYCASMCKGYYWGLNPHPCPLLKRIAPKNHLFWLFGDLWFWNQWFFFFFFSLEKSQQLLLKHFNAAWNLALSKDSVLAVLETKTNSFLQGVILRSCQLLNWMGCCHLKYSLVSGAGLFPLVFAWWITRLQQ